MSSQQFVVVNIIYNRAMSSQQFVVGNISAHADSGATATWFPVWSCAKLRHY